MSAQDDAKAARERDIFMACAEAAGLPVRKGSVESRPPPEPDILCDLEGEGPVAFELAELADAGLAEVESLAIRRGVAPTAVWIEQTIEKLREKVEQKTYTTPHPLELIGWASAFILPPDSWIPLFEPGLRVLHGRSRFRRIWVVNLGGPKDERGVWFVNPPRA